MISVAYDLHIFRGDNWWEDTEYPITCEELLSVEGVKRADGITAADPRRGISLGVSGVDMFSFGEALFVLKKGIVTIAAQNEAAAETMRPAADALGAVIQGDDGEFY